jgi:UDPglucose--hexose-1-phosphate uridylyltransferase
MAVCLILLYLATNILIVFSRGAQESASKITLPEYDPAVRSISPPFLCFFLTTSQCYLCPRNQRAQGDQNPDYKSTFAFVNDYSAVKETQAEYKSENKVGGGLIIFQNS